jgi:hypothetical protein
MIANIRQRLAAKLVAYQQSRALRQLQSVSGGLLDELTHYAAESRSTGCQWTDYWTLYAAIRKYRPREVLECGTGVSTIVIAHALLANGRGRVTSMEESGEWFAMACRLLPDRYKSVVDLRLSETVADGHAMFRGIRYKDVPARPYDFIFVDGPDFAGDLKQTESCDFDFIHVLRNSDTPIRGIVDSRTGTFWTLARILGTAKVRFSYLQRHGIILPCTRSDIRDTRKIVDDDMRQHIFRRPARSEYLI